MKKVNIFHRFKNKKVQFLVNMVMITIGCAAYAAGVFLFLDPNALASGGISGAEDIKNLRELGKDNLEGVIVGKALYAGRTTFKELDEAAND